MNEPVPEAPTPRDSVSQSTDDTASKNNNATDCEIPKSTSSPPALDVKSITDHTLQFLATATNETLVACVAGLGVSTYLVLGRVGLVLIGVVGGVVLHATWEGDHSDRNAKQGAGGEARKRELGADIAQRVLKWREQKGKANAEESNDTSDMSLKLYSGKKLDYSEFKPETAEALTELTDAVVRDYVKYVCAVLVP